MGSMKLKTGVGPQTVHDRWTQPQEKSLAFFWTYFLDESTVSFIKPGKLYANTTDHTANHINRQITHLEYTNTTNMLLRSTSVTCLRPIGHCLCRSAPYDL